MTKEHEPAFFMGTPGLEARYLDSCKRHQTQPNAEVVSWFSKAKTEMNSCGGCHLVISLDHLQDTDLLPLVDVFVEIHSFDVDTVDVVHKSPRLLNSEHLIVLMLAIGDKLHAVNLQDSSLGEDFLSNLSKRGVSCEVSSFWSLQIQKLNMVGRFTQLHTLNLDFCTSITSFHKDCFSGMPNLMRLSMCETRVANLWTTTAVLSKLPSLVELRFQKCLCCQDTGPCASLYSEKANLLIGEETGSVLPNYPSYKAVQSVSHGSTTHKVLDEVEQIIDKESVFMCAQKQKLRNGGRIVGYVPSTGVENSILGLCWLKKYPSKLIAGSDNGSLKLFDINCIPPKVPDFSFSYDAVTFDDFEQLTSVHVNSMDDRLLVSGYTRNIALYDIATGGRMELFRDLHCEPINVAKFANHSPFLFATSSFDRDVKMWDLRETPVRPCYTVSSSRENVMVCFSPDDHYLLVSAVDNEVKQLLAGDGRIQMKFEIASTGSAHNYTRSYYMNGRDYVISGSCDEHVVRICCAQTGRRLRDVFLEDGNSGNSMYVQSLRGDPFRDFHFSVLAASTRSSSKCEIMMVNLLASIDQVKDHPYNQSFRPAYSLGG
ncbi:hypothetical protein NL676_022868 [Syzygium grande]|nr:hypothetical protein NL676_022868 [Syzygium grande]